jgi:hypothetical protein
VVLSTRVTTSEPIRQRAFNVRDADSKDKDAKDKLDIFLMSYNVIPYFPRFPDVFDHDQGDP